MGTCYTDARLPATYAVGIDTRTGRNGQSEARATG